MGSTLMLSTFSTYDVVGTVSTFFLTLSTCGIAFQLKKILGHRQEMRREGTTTKSATQGLSLSRFMTSFTATFAMFLYGLTLPHFNHYLVWPRIFMLLLSLSIVFQIWKDKRDTPSLSAFLLGSMLLGVSAWIAATQYRLVVHDSGLPYALIFVSCAFLIQGGHAQIMKIRRTGQTGALSLPMHQLFFITDISSMIFAIVMGFHDGWPVFLFHAVSLGLQITTMWHFRWVRFRAATQDIP